MTYLNLVWRAVTPSRRARRVRFVASMVAATLVIVDAIVLSLLIAGVPKVPLGFRTIRAHDTVGAAEVGAIVCGIIVLLQWDRRRIRHIAASGVCAMIVVALTSRAALSPRTIPVGDQALIESYTLLATHGKLTVGPYSRLGWH